MQNPSIAVIGLGYVGLSLAALLSTQYRVVGVDTDCARVKSVNMRNSYLSESLLDDIMQEDLYLCASTDLNEISDVDFIIIAVPTDYDETTLKFDTSILDTVVRKSIELNSTATIVIKSTVPVGYTDKLIEYLSCDRILFSPEFLREGNSLYDNLHPTRIVVGTKCERSQAFSDLLCSVSEDNVPVLLTSTNAEAEAIKLFANTFLAMRIAFFNELDTYSYVRNLDTRQIIEGVCFDPRIGNHYNNPSFGYGGYCLPKDTKQLQSNYETVPNNIIGATIESNSTRKRFVADAIIAKSPKCVGIFRLIMKAGSDNFRASAIQDILNHLKSSGIEIMIYEPLLHSTEYDSITVTSDLDYFKSACDLIVTNRNSRSLHDVSDKIFTRDIFNIN